MREWNSLKVLKKKPLIGHGYGIKMIAPALCMSKRDFFVLNSHIYTRTIDRTPASALEYPKG